ncbi:MAG: AraC family transcriptional regulator of adaptative response / DNA-3-methyladenine glycosylase II [Candidatus Endobugula sp.]|jgi:AraC family transcriptional regulator of adaptative response / DNA-3-methyladenine glycosylase II
MRLTPSAICRSTKNMSANNVALHTLQLQIHYRPPYHWQHMQRFLRARAIPQLEWCTDNSYGRTFEWPRSYDCTDSGSYGYFTAYHVADKHCFTVVISVNEVTHLKSIVNNIRRILDVDADTRRIENDLRAVLCAEKENANNNKNKRKITTATPLL